MLSVPPPAPVPVIAPPSADRPAASAPCLPAAVLRGARVVALGVYASPGKALPFMLAGSSYPVHRLAVEGDGKDPVVLVVAAYEPILWDLSAVRDRVRAVVASGYYPQAVTGVASATPIRFSSAVGTFRGSETCGRVRYAYGETADIESMAGDVKQAIGLHPSIFYGRYSAERIGIDGSTKPALDLSAVRASVPLVTEDDPQSGAVMKTLPSASEYEAGEPQLRVVEWNTVGAITRDVGGPARSGDEIRRPSAPAYVPRHRGTSLVSTAAAIWLALVGGLIWFWRRPRRRDHVEPALVLERPSATIVRSSDPPPPARPSPAQARLARLGALAAITDAEPLVVALHRYGRETQALERMTLDADLAEEAAAIGERHFEHLVARYRHARPTLVGAEGDHADETLTHALERLTARLRELGTEQHRRDLAGVDEASRFIVARHPD